MQIVIIFSGKVHQDNLYLTLIFSGKRTFSENDYYNTLFFDTSNILDLGEKICRKDILPFFQINIELSIVGNGIVCGNCFDTKNMSFGGKFL